MNRNITRSLPITATALLAPIVLALAACSTTPPASRTVSIPELAGTHWSVAAIDGRDTLRGTELTADFGVDGRVNGDSGCNRFSGPFVQTGATVNFGELLSTRRACVEDSRQRQEERMLAVMRGATSARLSGDELHLRGRAGSITLVPARYDAAYVATSTSSSPVAGRNVRYDCQGIVVDIEYGQKIARVQAPDSYDVLELQESDNGPLRYESAHSELRFREYDMLWGREGSPPRSCVERR